MSPNAKLGVAIAAVFLLGVYGFKTTREETTGLKEQLLQNPVKKSDEKKESEAAKTLDVDAVAAKLGKGQEPLLEAINGLGTTVNTKIAGLEDGIKKMPGVLKKEIQDTREVLVAKEKALKKERDLRNVLESRAYQEYKRAVKWFEDQHRNHMDASGTTFVSSLFEIVNDDESQMKQKARDEWVASRTLAHIKSVEKIKHRLAVHHGFTVDQIKELEKIEKAE